MEVTELEPSLVDKLTDSKRSNRQLLLRDPVSDLIMCRIRNPKMQVTGYSNMGARCLDLHKFQREPNITPDFGFDPKEPVVEAEKKDPWNYMSHIILPKCTQRCLWLCIDDMNQIKRDYTKILENKQRELPKYLRHREDTDALFAKYTIETRKKVAEDHHLN